MPVSADLLLFIMVFCWLLNITAPIDMFFINFDISTWKTHVSAEWLLFIKVYGWMLNTTAPTDLLLINFCLAGPFGRPVCLGNRRRIIVDCYQLAVCWGGVTPRRCNGGVAHPVVYGFARVGGCTLRRE